MPPENLGIVWYKGQFRYAISIKELKRERFEAVLVSRKKIIIKKEEIKRMPKKNFS